MRRERPPDARTEPLHAPGAVTAQVDQGVLTGEQRRDRGFRALVQIDGARVATPEDRRSKPRRAAGRLHYHAPRRGIAPAAKPELASSSSSNRAGARRDSGRSSTSYASASVRKGQWLAQRQHGARLVEQAAHQGGAHVTRVKDEMQRPQIGG